jgi:hypothetical protein
MATGFALDDPSPNRIRFDLKRVMRTRHRIDDFQETYFVLGDLGELLELARIDSRQAPGGTTPPRVRVNDTIGDRTIGHESGRQSGRSPPAFSGC